MEQNSAPENTQKHNSTKETFNQQKKTEIQKRKKFPGKDASKINTSQLSKVQNARLLRITGRMKTTPIQAMEKHTSLGPLADRCKEKVYIHKLQVQFWGSHHDLEKTVGFVMATRLQI
nr:hypothetical protein BaRGS_026088 [Batillaria attramentaria]